MALAQGFKDFDSRLNGTCFHESEQIGEPSLIHRCINSKDFYESTSSHQCEAGSLHAYETDNPNFTSVFCSECHEVWKVHGQIRHDWGTSQLPRPK